MVVVNKLIFERAGSTRTLKNHDTCRTPLLIYDELTWLIKVFIGIILGPLKTPKFLTPSSHC